MATKTNLAWLAKSVTDRKMLSLLVVSSFRLHHNKFEQKGNLMAKSLTLLLVTVVLAKIRGFKLVIG